MATTTVKNVFDMLVCKSGLSAQECAAAFAQGALTLPQFVELQEAITARAVAAVPQNVVVRQATDQKDGCRVSDHYMAKGRIVVQHGGCKTAGLSVQDLAVIVLEMDSIRALIGAVDFAKTKPVTWRSKTDPKKEGTNLWGRWNGADVFVCHKPTEFNEDMCVKASMLVAKPAK